MRPRRSALVLLLAPLFFAVVLMGQERANQAAQTPSSSQAAAGPAQTAAQKPEKKPGVAGPGAELAEASREAAGEENAEFKHSASVQWLAKTTGLGIRNAYWADILINFAIVAVLIVLFVKAKVPAMFRVRTATIQRGMEEAGKASADARARLAEIEGRLARLDAEIAEMRSAAEAEAAGEEERIRVAAAEDQKKIIEMAQQEIAAATRAARRELKSYAAELAVGLAEKRIHVDAGTDQALVRSFVDQLSSGSNGMPHGSGKETS